MLVGSKVEELSGRTMKHYCHYLAVMHGDLQVLGAIWGSCNQCPGVDSLSSSLQAVMAENDTDTVELKQ